MPKNPKPKSSKIDLKKSAKRADPKKAEKKSSPKKSDRKVGRTSVAKAGSAKVVPEQVGSRHAGNDKAVVHESTIHGRGVRARIAIASGERICEYRGERIDWPEALRRHPHDPEQPFHTFYFSIDDDHVIDGNVRGDFSRFINHSCAPNCEAELEEKKNGVIRVFIHALRDIPAGEELVYNYGLTLDERYTPKLKKEFACHCGSPQCTGTMLSPKR